MKSSEEQLATGGASWKQTAGGWIAAAVLSPLAVFCTAVMPAFRSIPWSLSYLVLALIAELGGTVPAMFSALISMAGVYLFVLSPHVTGPGNTYVVWKLVAFLLISGIILVLVRQRTVALRAAQLSEAHYRSLSETASDVIVSLDRDARILSVNPAVEKTFGYRAEELIGKQLSVLAARDASTWEAALDEGGVESGAHITLTEAALEGRRKDGREFPVEVSFAKRSQGQMRFTGFIRDISERQRAQALRVQAEKISAVGKLASSIAHEINNPLEALTNLLFLARTSVDLESAQGFLESADVELRRASSITAQALRFHKQTTQPSRVGFEELVSGILTGQHSRLRNLGVAVQEQNRSSAVVLCLEGEIRQVLKHLISNALDAMQAGERTLTLRGGDGRDWRTGEPGLVLTVADTGSGMDPTTRSRLFDAFYTTKGIGGTGLGLWLSRETVERHRGRLLVRSCQRAGASGSVFRLFLPMEDATKAADGA